MRVLITGSAGFIGQQLLRQLSVQHPDWTLIAADIRPQSRTGLGMNVELLQLDISKSREVKVCISTWKPQAIVHLASVVTPPRGMTDQQLKAIDVGGTRTIIDAAVSEAVEQLIITSSGAAYGYSCNNAEWIDEDQPLRGHDHFAYAKHKREVEVMLAQAREKNPQLKQLVLRAGTILGKQMNNQITDLFNKPTVLGVKGSDSRFVFIWDQDVINIICQGLEKQAEGIFNLAGDGALTLREIAVLLGKPYRPLPALLIKSVLGILKPLGLSQYGPEQIDFLRYRPVLANARLKNIFGYTPRYTSREAFLAFIKARGIGQPAA
ncbi:NAD-dependent epimerase/dehydratase family protein [Pseudomonas sp. M30-35]|uniref:NAD-dependent epimerase/dehydratase family protein n=1 Tax=Pseudomonas sp. M30-35 TaxID=1981174 RepID=UPI000B3CCEEA|nr:NAD-dependent epimerase/dehydratase family protein [Pseudomonas sp. M30-35]ARU86516.1 epimerase [Pseudomonas sp. M30-35]